MTLKSNETVLVDYYYYWVSDSKDKKYFISIHLIWQVSENSLPYIIRFAMVYSVCFVQTRYSIFCFENLLKKGLFDLKSHDIASHYRSENFQNPWNHCYQNVCCIFFYIFAVQILSDLKNLTTLCGCVYAKPNKEPCFIISYHFRIIQ